MLAGIIDERLVGGEIIAEVLLGLGAAIQERLHGLPVALSDYIPAYNAVGATFNRRDHIDNVFLSPTKVNSSSNSMTSTSSPGTGVAGN